MRAGLDRLLWLMTMCAAFLLFVLMALTVVDVIGRAAFRAPLSGAYDITKYSLGVLLFTALPAVTANDRHLTVDLFLHIIPRRAKRPLGFVSSLIACVVLSIFCWRLWLEGHSKAAYGDTMSTLGIPVAPFAYLLSILAAVSALIALFQVLAHAGLFAGWNTNADKRKA